ncbi:RNA-binding S4 domain-containing protein [Desulfuribacillus alkaliarsenatis]|uniref:Uncharacterized protein n=1 Tax=Desulfuribacillus alkaliarsenatis TaxID=766136 RepID=A0A1E5G3L6_9FIRM|nr:hypothetical protein BHF68_03585 [Desulfuribacillus alkaliarsenatis]
MKEVHIKDDYITLGQLLKKESILGSGGEVKIFLAEVPVYVNEQPANQRGKKLFINDIVEIEGEGSFIIKKA